MNALQIIESAMRVTNALASGETPTAAEQQDALSILNLMLDAWSADRLMVFTITISEFPLIVGQQTYALGTGGDFDIPRPARLDRAGIVSLNNPSQPLELPLEMLTTDQWAAVPVKNITSALPQKLYNDGAFPFMNLSFWCVPTQTVNVRLYYWTLLQQFADLTTDYEFPPGYFEAIKYNLAVRLAAENIGTLISPAVAALAIASIMRIKTINLPELDLRVDAALSAKGRHYNWRSDTYQ